MTIAARLVDPTGTDSAKIATSRVGSTRARMVVSRLAPIPPNAVPVSMPGQRQRDRAQRQQRHHREQIGAPGPAPVAVVTNGATAATTRQVATSSSGAVRNTSLVPCGAIGCLRISLRRSRHGCPTPGAGAALHPGPDLPHHAGQQR